MTAVVLDQQRVVTVTNQGTVPQITIQSLGLQGPQGLPTMVNGKSGSSITLNSADVGALDLTTRGAVNGVASLDGSGLVPTAQLPVSALSTNFVDLSTNQTINGTKTFGTIPVGPASNPTTANQLVRKAYADLMLPLTGGTMIGAITLAADPVAALQPATKQYVDAIVSGLSPKASCRCATTTALPANTYSNGASGVGATLTATANGALGSIDGATPGVSDRVLVKNEAAGANDGVYTVTQVGDSTHPYILTRATDVDTNTDAAGAFVFIEGGTANSGSGWTLPIIPGNLIVGTTAQNWTQFSGAGEITAGTGLTKSGNTLSLATPVSVANGGTGSATQNFVDLTTSQTIAGAKTLSNTLTVNNSVVVAAGAANPSVQVTSTQAGGQIFRAIAQDAATVVYEGEVAGDVSSHRYAVYADGHSEIGSGAAARDVKYGRATTKVFYHDTTLLVGAVATLGSGGVGVIEVANATTSPASTPAGGGVLYALSGRPNWKDAAGNVIALGGTTIVTSTTRPATPFQGMEIFESDTGRSMVYDGSHWVPQGTIVSAAPNATSSSGTATSSTTETFDTVLGYHTVTLVSGRRYRATLDGLLGNLSVANDIIQLNIRDSQSASNPTSASANIAQSQYTYSSTGSASRNSILLRQTFLCTVTGTHVFGVSATRISGTGIFTPVGVRELYIEDLGVAY